MKLKSAFILLFSLLHMAHGLIAQDQIPVKQNLVPKNGFNPTKTVVKLDPITRLTTSNIPFDRAFILRVYFDRKPKDPADKAGAVKRFFFSRKRKQSSSQEIGFYRLENIAKDIIEKYDPTDPYLLIYDAIEVAVPALDPNEDYTIGYSYNIPTDGLMDQYLKVFHLFYQSKVQEGIKEQDDYKLAHTSMDHDGQPIANSIIGGQIAIDYYKANPTLKAILDKNKGNLAKAKNDMVDYIFAHVSFPISNSNDTAELFQAINDVISLNTNQFTLETSSSFAIVADAGVIYAGMQPGFNVATPFVGLNISFRPMDSDIPFKLLTRTGLIKWYQRFTINLGITTQSIAKTGYRDNLFGSNNVMVGFGYKFSHVFNLGFGGLLYSNVDPNPLVEKKSLGVAPYMGLSINLKIKKALGDIANAFKYGN